MHVLLGKIGDSSSYVNIDMFLYVYFVAIRVDKNLSVLFLNRCIFPKLVFLYLNLQCNISHVLLCNLMNWPSPYFLLCRSFILLNLVNLIDNLWQIILLVSFHVQCNYNRILSCPVFVDCRKYLINNLFYPLLQNIIHQFVTFDSNFSCRIW